MENMLAPMTLEINIIKVKPTNVGLFTVNNVEATKITSDWYLWIHHTIDKIPDSKNPKYLWQKKHLENQTGHFE